MNINDAKALYREPLSPSEAQPLVSRVDELLAKAIKEDGNTALRLSGSTFTVKQHKYLACHYRDLGFDVEMSNGILTLSGWDFP